jgi:hypothetical protein
MLSNVANAVVKVFSTLRYPYPYPYRPWTKQAPAEATASGVIIEGKPHQRGRAAFSLTCAAHTWTPPVCQTIFFGSGSQDRECSHTFGILLRRSRGP